jgi:hypothetical protein
MKVDDKQLEEYLNGSALSEMRPIRHRLFLTRDSKYRVKQFLVDHLGIHFDEKKTTLGQAIPEAMGKQVVVELGHQASQDGTQVFNIVKSTAKV